MSRGELNFLTAMFEKIFLLNSGIGDCVQEEIEVLLHTSRCVFSTCILTKAKLSRTENHIPATVQKWTWADPCWCKQALREMTKYRKDSTELYPHLLSRYPHTEICLALRPGLPLAWGTN